MSKVPWECPECGQKLMAREDHVASGSVRCFCVSTKKQQLPGTELKKLIPNWVTQLLRPEDCPSCDDYAAKMDRWGVAGCERRYHEIVQHLVEQAGIAGKLAAPLARRKAGEWVGRAIATAKEAEVVVNPYNEPITVEVKGTFIPTPKSSRAVVQIAPSTDFLRQTQITGSLAEHYANKCGADYVLLWIDESPQWPMGNKYQLRDVLNYYDQTLYLDTDVVVRPDAPDIFEHVGPEVIGVYNEYLALESGTHARWIEPDAEVLCQSQGITPVHSRLMVNGGVMVIPRSLAHLYEPPPKPFVPRWTTDQHWLSIQIQREKPPVKWLGREWNHTLLPPDFWEAITDAHFIHVNGSRPIEYRLELLRRLVAGNFTPFHPPPDSTWQPMWSKHRKLRNVA